MTDQIAVFLAALVTVGIAVPTAMASCGDEETRNVNMCIMQFVADHHQHMVALKLAPNCSLHLLNCTSYSNTIKCLHALKLNGSCTQSLEGSINSYLSGIQIKCQVSQFDKHCRISLLSMNTESTAAVNAASVTALVLTDKASSATGLASSLIVLVLQALYFMVY